MARLSLSELTNQLQSTRTAFDKWGDQVISQTEAAKQRHLDKLADKQSALIISHEEVAVQTEEVLVQNCVCLCRSAATAGNTAGALHGPGSGAEQAYACQPALPAAMHVWVTVYSYARARTLLVSDLAHAAELQAENEQEAALRKKLDEVNSQSQKVDLEHRQMQQDVEQRKKHLQASEAGDGRHAADCQHVTCLGHGLRGCWLSPFLGLLWAASDAACTQHQWTAQRQ